MNGCEEFEIAIEKRLHGALDAAGAARLDAHLASCAACRRFEEMTKKTEETMQALASDFTDGFDWERIRVRIQGIEAAYRRAARPLAMSLVAILMALAVWGISGEGLSATIVGAAVMAGIALAHVRRSRERLRELEAAESSRAGLIEFYRQWLDRRIAALRSGRVVVTILAALTAVLLSDRVVMVMLAAFLVLVVLRAHLVELPRLRRERAELD